MDTELETALDAVLAGAVAQDLENDRLDFKEQGRSISDALQNLAEAASCFANAVGGYLVVGVRDNASGADAFIGCTLDPVLTKRSIFERTEPHLTVDTDLVRRNNADLLVIRVPSSPDVHAVRGRVTERIGAACEPMSTSRIATVVAERRGEDWSAEDSQVPVDEAQPSAFEVARELLERTPDRARRNHAKRSDADLLRALGLVSDRGTLTRGGNLLFGKSAGDQITYIARKTPAGALTANAQFPAPLLPALVRVFDFIDARLESTSLNLPNGQQLQLQDLPTAAVREAVVNGVMHRDHRRTGPVQVEHSSTRMVVTSPGPFVRGISVDNVLTASSRSRNPSLAAAIRTLGLAETAGTGVDRMYAEMARIGHRPPVFETDGEQVRVTLLGGAPNTAVARFTATLSADEADDADTMLVLFTLLTTRTVTAAAMVPLLQKSAVESLAVLDRLAREPVCLIERTRESARRAQPVFRLREHAVAALGSALSYARRTVDETDRKIIAMVREAGAINARVVKVLFDIDTPRASRLLSDLVERGILTKTSEARRGPNVCYGPGEAFPKSTVRTHRRKPSTDTGSDTDDALW